MTVQFPASEARGLRVSASGMALTRARASLERAAIQKPVPRKKHDAEVAFDTLEKRYLLSADISPYLDTFDDGLDRLDALADDIDTFEEMAAEIPVLGQSLGELASLSDTLRDDLIDPLRTALASATDFDDAITRINAISADISVDELNSISDDGEISWDLTFDKTINLSDLLGDFGTEFAALGFDFAGSLGATIDLSLDFGFGVLLDPSLSPADAGFIDADSMLSIDADANLSTLGALRVGLLGGATAMIDGSVSAGLDISVNNTGAADDGKLTISELDAAGTTVLDVLTDNDETNFAIGIDVDTSGISGLTGVNSLGILDNAVTLTLVDDNGAPASSIFTATDIDVTVNTDDLADFTRINAGTLLTFLSSLGDKIQTLSTAFQELTQFDLFDVSFDKIADYAQAFETLTSALSVPGLVGATTLDLPNLGTHSFQIAYTVVDAAGEVVASSTTGNINIDFSSIDLGNIETSLAAAINAALPASAPDVEVVIESGRLLLRSTIDGDVENVFSDLSLQNVADEITDAIGWQEDQTALRLPTFRTMQDFAEAILDVPVIADTLGDIGLTYADGTLTFNLDVLNTIANQSIGFNFSEGITLIDGVGELGEISLTGSATADLKSSIGLSLGLGLDLSALDGSTELSDLNGGAGIGFSTTSAPDLMFASADGTMFSVSFDSGDTTVQNLLDAINDNVENGGAVVASIDDLGNGLKLTDTTTGDGVLTIAGGPNSSAIYDLGFGFGISAAEDVNEIFGAPVLERFFIQDSAGNEAEVGASVTVTAEDINLYGSLSFLTFGVENGQLGGVLDPEYFADLIADRGNDELDPLEFALSLSLNDPLDPDADRIYLNELTLPSTGGSLTFDVNDAGLTAADKSLEVELGDGSTYTVNLAGIGSVEDALAEIETQTDSKVEAFVNPAGSAIVLMDTTADADDTAIADLILTGQPTAGDTVSVDGTTLTFGTDFIIGGTANDTAANLAEALATEFTGTYAAVADGSTVKLSHDAFADPEAIPADPSLSASLSATGSAWDIRTFKVLDPGSDDNSAARQLGLSVGFASEDLDNDGTILGSTILDGEFAGLGAFDFDGSLKGEMVLPLVFDGLEALGVSGDPIFLTIGFSQGSINSDIDISGEGFEDLLTSLQALGTQDLLDVVGQIAGVLNDQIDVLNADLPFLGTSISDVIGTVNDTFGGVIDDVNQSIATTLQTAVAEFRTQFETLVEALDPQDAIEFLTINSEGKTIVAAIQDLEAAAENLATDGFNILFDDVPGKLLSAVAALRGTIERITEKAAAAGTDIYDRIEDAGTDAFNQITETVESISDLTPNTETVLRILQQVLGFDLPDLEDILSDVLPVDLVSQIDMFLKDTIDDTIDYGTKTVAEIVALVAEIAEETQQTAIATIESFLDQADDIAEDSVKDAVAAVTDILKSLLGGVLGDLPIDVSGLGDVYELGITLGDEPEISLMIDTDGIMDAAGLVDAINVQVAATDLNGKVEAAVDNTGRFALKTVGDAAADATEVVLSTVDAALETALKVAQGVEGVVESVTGLVDRLGDLDGKTIFTLIKDLPYISDALQAVDEVARAFAEVNLKAVATYAEDNPGDLDQMLVDDLIAGVRDMVDGLVDDVRGALLAPFGGGVLNFDLDVETGLVELGVFYAPSFYNLDAGTVDFDFAIDGNAFGFGAGVSDSDLTLDIGGYIDLGFLLQLGSTVDGGFGSDFDLFVDADSVIGLTVDFAVSGTLAVQLGAVGVKFGAETLGDPFLKLTDQTGLGPAFIEVGIDDADPAIQSISGGSYLAIGDLALDVSAEAKLEGTLFAYDLGDAPIVWDNGGTDKQVDIGIQLTVSFSGGEFSFDPVINELTTEELDAIFASLLVFDLSLILDAFDFFVEAFGDFLDLLAEAPIIGGELEGVAAAYSSLEETLTDISETLGTLTDGEVVAFVQDTIFNAFDGIDLGDGISLGLFDDADDLLTTATQIDVEFTAPEVDLLDGVNNPALLIQPLRIGFVIEEEVAFDFGLDALVLEVATEGGVEIDLGLFLNIGFGLSLNDGAFLILPETAKVVEGDFAVALADDSSIGLSLFFLGLEATPWVELPDGFDATNVPGDANLAQGVSFEASLGLDLFDGGAGVSGTETAFDNFDADEMDMEVPEPSMADIVKLTDLGDLEVDANFQIEINIDLELRAGVSFDVDDSIVDDNLPSLSTYLNIDWVWNPSDQDAAGALGVQFYDLSLDFGEWIDNALGGVFDSIQRFTAPLQPFLDFLDFEIPIVSQLAVLFGQDPVTFLDAIGFLGSGVESVQRFLEILDIVDTVLDFIDTFASGSFINFGDFIISENPGLDLRQLENREVLSGGGLFDPGNYDGVGGIMAPTEGDVKTAIEDSGSGPIDELFDSLNDIGLFLPFLQDPAQLFGLLFGQRIDFVIWDIPRLEAEFGISYKFGPILPPVPLFVTIAGGFEIFLDLYVGYDSRGLETGDFLDGFYFGDWVITDDGTIIEEDALELGLSVFFEATASLSVLVAEAGVTGGVEAIIGANWADQDGDGKFYLDELLQRASQGIFCIFDLEGALEAFIEAFVKLGFDTPFGFVTIFEETFELLRVTLLDFSISCPPLPPPELGDQDGDGAVLLNIGTRAGERQAGADGDDDEYVQIFGDREADVVEDTISLWSSGITGDYFNDGVLTRQEIEGNLGDFNQELDLNRDGNIDTDEILAALDIDGGDTDNGEYALIVGFGEWEIYRNVTKLVGDAAGGDDEIVADCDSVLFALEIYGGVGEDTLIGGQGADTLIGGADADIVRGCTDDDLLLGDGTAVIDGFALNITNFITGTGEDAVYGGAGSDRIYGGGGNDTLRADGEDDDPNTSQDGNDTIFGGDGEDQIDGFLGNDVLFGGRGADNISGGQGNDTIRGDLDTDTVGTIPGDAKWEESASNVGEIDLITGGYGSDFIRGDGGNDIIYGEETDFVGDEISNGGDGFADEIHGDGGDDEIRGQLGSDSVYGGTGDDRLIGGAGGDAIYGNANKDTIYGDRLPGELVPISGNDTIEGGAAGDVIFGQGGEDWILGGIDTLSVQGNYDDYAYGGSDGGDTIDGGADNDIILGDDGTISASNMYSSQTDGTGGNDVLRGESGDDQVAGGRGSDTIYGDNGGGIGQDILIGDEVVRNGASLKSEVNEPTDAADKIYGYGGNDIIIAGGGNDTAFGSLGDDIIAGDYAQLMFKSVSPTNLFDDTAWLFSVDPGFGGDDRLIGDAGSDIMLGGFGNDQVFGGSLTDGTNIMFGDSGLVVRDDSSAFENDVYSIYGDLGGKDTIIGGGMVDIAIGGTGDDTILTLGGDDIALGDAGFVLRDGGLDPELVSSSFFGTGLTGTNDFMGIALGLSGGDLLAEGQDFIDAGADNDIALGGLDADLIYGRTGNDVLLGDNGEVVYDGGGTGLGNVTAIRTLGTEGGIDAIFGEAGADIAFAGASGDYVFGDLTAIISRNGDDFAVVSEDFDTVEGAGDDILAGDFGELLFNPAGTYDILKSLMTSSGGSDLIEGHQGNDIALGGADDDIIHGEATTMRYDLLDGAFGSDTLLGDSGYIDFDASSAFGYDVIRTSAPTDGGSDVILGNDGADMILGGMEGDFLYGDRIADVNLGLATRLVETSIRLSDSGATQSGEDTILGDNGQIYFEQTTDTVADRFDIVGDVELDGDTTVIQSTVNDFATDGGADLILGDGQGDLIMGGLFSDRIWGDEGSTGDDEGDDLIFGDNGKAWQQAGKGGALEIGDDYYAILTASDEGLGDAIFAEGGNDTALGQQGDDVIFGGDGDDNLIGGHNVDNGVDELETLTPEQIDAILPNKLLDLNPTDLPNVNDVIDGNAGEDIIAGDNAYMYQWGGQANGPALDSLRFQELITDAELYRTTGQLIDISVYEDTEFFVDLGFAPNILGTGFNFDLLAGATRSLYLLDFDANTAENAAENPGAARPFGDDVITGGSEDDEIYGGLGDDVIQGDGEISIAPDIASTFDILTGQHDFNAKEGDVGVLVNPDPNATSENDLGFVVGSATDDGDDYIEGNGGNDRIYGNLGQDDIIGGSSGLAALDENAPSASGAALRPDGADLIYGGSANAGWLTRTADHVDAGDPLVDMDNYHTADADMILGDNGNIYRLVDQDGDALTFNYASGEGYEGLEIRVVELLDYAYTIAESTDGEGNLDWKMTFNSFGTGAGDLIHGESGDDIIHGMTGDDVIFGEAGDDDIYGEAGADVLYGGRGVDGITGDDGLFATSRNGLTEELIGLDTVNEQDIIRTPGNLRIALIHRTGDLLKDATMIGFDQDGVDFGLDWMSGQVTSANDIIFGGWENDFLHSGYGDDAVTGAEALPIYYDATGSSFDQINALLEAMQAMDPAAPAPADSPFWSAFAMVNPGDILGFGAVDDEEFALYKEDNPRSKIVLNLAGFEKVDFILNNDATDGLPDMTFTFDDNGGNKEDIYTDGADHLFGDLGNDWIVGGTGRDHMYGGRGNDLIQMDDDLSTQGDANTKPDAYQEYADIVYDGAGRDYMILNTGADRAIGWVGEFNSYIVPFSPFGAFQIARLLQPQTEQFVLDLADASGGDEGTPDILRFAEQIAIDSKLDNPLDPEIYEERKGSPFNELGMVRQEDFDWQDQTGSPDDPQAGNLKGKREIMRREIWDGDNTQALQAELNALEAAEWYIVEQAWAEIFAEDYTLQIPGDILISGGVQMMGTIGEGDDIFRTVEMEATIDIDKPSKKVGAEAYFMFDVEDGSNFKFAGIDAKSNEILIGRVVDGEWIVDERSRERIKTGFDHVLNVKLEGSSVTVSFNGKVGIVADMSEDLTDGGYGVAAPGIQVFFQDITVVATPKIDVSTSELEAIPDESEIVALESQPGYSIETLSVDWSNTAVVEDTEKATSASASTEDSGTVTDEPTGKTTGSDDVNFGTTEVAPSSDTSESEDEELIVVEGWAPRDDFAA